MPKLKTHKGTKDRFHITGSGKVMQIKIGKSHLRRKKTKRARRLYDEKVSTHPSNVTRIRRLLP